MCSVVRTGLVTMPFATNVQDNFTYAEYDIPLDVKEYRDCSTVCFGAMSGRATDTTTDSRDEARLGRLNSPLTHFSLLSTPVCLFTACHEYQSRGRISPFRFKRWSRHRRITHGHPLSPCSPNRYPPLL